MFTGTISAIRIHSIFSTIGHQFKSSGTCSYESNRAKQLFWSFFLEVTRCAYFFFKLISKLHFFIIQLMPDMGTKHKELLAIPNSKVLDACLPLLHNYHHVQLTIAILKFYRWLYTRAWLTIAVACAVLKNPYIKTPQMRRLSVYQWCFQFLSIHRII